MPNIEDLMRIYESYVHRYVEAMDRTDWLNQEHLRAREEEKFLREEMDRIAKEIGELYRADGCPEKADLWDPQ